MRRLPNENQPVRCTPDREGTAGREGLASERLESQQGLVVCTHLKAEKGETRDKKKVATFSTISFSESSQLDGVADKSGSPYKESRISRGGSEVKVTSPVARYGFVFGGPSKSDSAVAPISPLLPLIIAATQL